MKSERTPSRVPRFRDSSETKKAQPFANHGDATATTFIMTSAVIDADGALVEAMMAGPSPDVIVLHYY